MRNGSEITLRGLTKPEVIVIGSVTLWTVNWPIKDLHQTILTTCEPLTLTLFRWAFSGLITDGGGGAKRPPSQNMSHISYNNKT